MKKEFEPFMEEKAQFEGKDGTFKISHHYGTNGVDYLIRKTKKGWTIKMLSIWMS